MRRSPAAWRDVTKKAPGTLETPGLRFCSPPGCCHFLLRSPDWTNRSECRCQTEPCGGETGVEGCHWISAAVLCLSTVVQTEISTPLRWTAISITADTVSRGGLLMALLIPEHEQVVKLIFQQQKRDSLKLKNYFMGLCCNII